MASLLSDASTPLSQLGQSYTGQPNPNPPAFQGGGARTWGDLLNANFGGRPMGAFWNQAFVNRPLPDQMLAQPNNQNFGISPPQTSNYADVAASGPPATSAYPSGAGAASGPPANPPAMPGTSPGTGLFGYAQRSPPVAGVLNAGGFGGIGAMYGGQRPGIGARYWARLNNIGGS